MFEYFDVETPASRFCLGEWADFSDVVTLWQGRRNNRPLPGWGDFCLKDFIGWHAQMALSELLSEKGDLCFRFFGSEMVRLQGSDLTGAVLSERLPQAYKSIYRDHFMQLSAEPAIALGFPPAASDLKKERFMAVVHMPLANDGHKVDRFLHFAVPVPYQMDLGIRPEGT